MSKSRPYSLIVIGASGFTGQLVCKYLSENYGNKHRFGIAGRDKAKLEKLQAQLNNKYNYKPDILTFTSIDDEKQLDSIISQSKVVIDTMGPFQRLGEQVVRSCVKVGTDYVDITGETHWVKQMIDKYHETAAKN